MALLSVRLVFFALVIMFSTKHGFAQHLSGVVGMFNAGFSSTHNGSTSIEQEISDSISLRSGYTLVGAEGYYRNGNAIFFVSGNLGVQGAQIRDDRFLEPFMWTTHGGFGWLLSRNLNLCVYPAFGLGVSGLSITEHSQRSNAHTQIMRITKATAELSLHCDYLLIEPSSNDTIVNGIALGAKVGYNFGLSSPAALHGWYFTISVGGLAFMRKDR